MVKRTEYVYRQPTYPLKFSSQMKETAAELQRKRRRTGGKETQNVESDKKIEYFLLVRQNAIKILRLFDKRR